MLKYLPQLTEVVLEEIPDKVSLAVEVTNCQGRCEGCHSPFLREDIGVELTAADMNRLLADNFGVNCVLFLGEGRDLEALLRLARHVRGEHPGVAVALYSGRPEVPEEAIWEAFDYVKVGPYIPSRGPLNEPTTNQRLYEVSDGICAMPDGSARVCRLRTDITSRFWRRPLEG